MSLKNPLTCTLKQARAAGEYLKTAGIGGGIKQAFLQPTSCDGEEKYYQFKLRNGVTVHAAILHAVIKGNPKGCHQMLTDIAQSGEPEFIAEAAMWGT